MCGFLGSINFEITKKIFNTSLDKIIHRGKDQKEFNNGTKI